MPHILRTLASRHCSPNDSAHYIAFVHYVARYSRASGCVFPVNTLRSSRHTTHIQKKKWELNTEDGEIKYALTSDSESFLWQEYIARERESSFFFAGNLHIKV